MAEGIEKRHARDCASWSGGRCRCSGGFRASVYSPRDGKKIRKTFTTEAEARSWQADAKRAVNLGMLRTPSRKSLREAAAAWIEGAEAGDIRNRSGQAISRRPCAGIARRSTLTFCRPMGIAS
jgi:hypothetical protein